MRTVVLSTSELHEKAIKLYEKCGFVRKEMIPNDRTILHNGQWILSGTVEMEISAEDYNK
jgi:RimJ/RimL family protein N-acetyltransferase